MKILTIIATYNEKDNIMELVPKILAQKNKSDILIVDDNSPDGTGILADKMSKKNKKIKVIHRKNKMGLGTACIEGFKYGIDKGYNLICEIDADLTHDPKYLGDFVEMSKKYDLVLGSRWIKGGGVIGWPWYRYVASRIASKVSGILLGLKVKDATNGFRCYNREVLEKIDLNSITSSGYSFLEEMIYLVQKSRFSIKEIPIILIDRRFGQSKMNKKEIINSSKAIFRLFIRRCFR